MNKEELSVQKTHGRLKSRLDQTFKALQYPNYRLWFFGQMASLFGTWMQSTAQGYLIYQLTHSASYLGLVGFAGGVPTWIFMLYGGVISDRLPRRKLLIITQIAMMILAFILALLAATGTVQPWHIVLLAFLLGVVNAFDAPARMAFTLEMVSREDLGNAIALNSAMFNTATAIGPAVAGLAYASFGPAWCFVINGISFIAVIYALWKMQIQPLGQPARHGSTMEDLRDGLKYTLNHKTIRSLIFIVGLITLLGLSYGTLIPEWAVNILKGDATTNGLLQSARGLGSLFGALMIASLGRFRFRGRVLTAGTFAFPLTLIAFSYVRWLPLSLIILVISGWSAMMILNMCNTLVQSIVPDMLRGRVMALYSLVFMGVMPLGSLLFGGLADWIGSPHTILLTAGVTLLAALFFWVALPQVRNLE